MSPSPKQPRMNTIEKLYVAVVCVAAPLLLVLAVLERNWLLVAVAAASAVLLGVWWSSRRKTTAAAAAVTEEEVEAIITRSPDHASAVAALRQAHPAIGLTDAHLIIQSRAGARFAERGREQDNETGS